MRDPFLDTPAGQWFVDTLGVIAESDDYFALLDEARAQGAPEQCLDILYELDKRLMALLESIPNQAAFEKWMPILRTILVRCDLSIAMAWLVVHDKNPRNTDLRNQAIQAAWAQYKFLRDDLVDYDVATDNGLPTEIRVIYLRLGQAFAS